MYYELRDHFQVRASIDQTWDFFTRVENLRQVMPQWLRFQDPSNRPQLIGPDATLDFAIRWMGLRWRWQAKIIDWSPPRQFIDLQTRGPYVLWHHQHAFRSAQPGTECFDRVIYKLPGGPIGRLVHHKVSQQLREVFRYRRKVIGEKLGWIRSLAPEVEISRL